MNTQALTVLLVEDDRDLAASVADYLLLENIHCDHAYHGQAGLDFALNNNYDVLLLDVMLPRMDGLTLCQKLRERGVDTPVLMLTARDTLDDKIAGFTAGSDDYLVKPFALEEVAIRIQALSKRRSGQVQKLVIGELVMDLQARQVHRNDQQLKISPTGWKLLEALMRASPGVLSRSQLEQMLWPDEPPDTNSFKVHLYNLRCAVDKPFDTKLIHTVPNQGFQVKDV